MRAHQVPDRRSPGSRIEGLLTWLGGADRSELGERLERSNHAIAGAVVLLNAVLAWLVAAAVMATSTSMPLAAILPLTLVFGLLVGAITRAIASGSARHAGAVLGRGAVAVGIGVIVGELATVALLSGSINQEIGELAQRDAATVPAVVVATTDLDQTRTARTALDDAVTQARNVRDQALVVARCEYNPSPACPETKITGVPGQGPETMTANDFLASAQRELDTAVTARDREAPQLDATATAQQTTLDQARAAAVAHADRGLGARWVAMHDYTSGNLAVVLLRLVTVVFFALLSLLPLALRVWRGETSQDRAAAARAERDRAELAADTAIAVKQAEVRAAAEILWAERQLTNARLAVAAQNEIDRVQQRRRVVETLDGPLHVTSQRTPEPLPQPKPVEAAHTAPEVDVTAVRAVTVEKPDSRASEDREEDMYLPIAAEAEAAARGAARQLPAPLPAPRVEENLPDRVGPEHEQQPPATRIPSVPTIPDVTRAAARWVRPLVPPFVARAIDTTTHPLRAARQAFEEFEEITFTLKRTHRVTVDTEEGAEQPRQAPPRQVHDGAGGPRRLDSALLERDYGYDAGYYGGYQGDYQSDARPYGYLDGAGYAPGLTRGEPRYDLAGREGPRELREHEGPRQLRKPSGPRELPPAE